MADSTPDAPKEYRQSRFSAPPGATEILLIRHGESRAATPANPFPLVGGHGDPELHANGQAQAEAVGQRLKGEPIQAVYVSNLRRTHETAAPLCRHLGQQPIVDPDLREVFLGDWEGGLFRIKAHEQDPLFVKMQQDQRWDVIPNGESPDVLTLRLTAALHRIHDRHPDQLVAAVAHGGVIGHILHLATGARPFAFGGCDNGSISHLVITADRQLLVRRFNDSSHLPGGFGRAAAQMT